MFQVHSSFLVSWNVSVSDKSSFSAISVIPEYMTQFCAMFFCFIFCKFLRFFTTCPLICPTKRTANMHSHNETRIYIFLGKMHDCGASWCMWPEVSAHIHDRVINYLPIPFKNLAYSPANPVLSRYVHFKLGLNILEDTEPTMFHYIILF